MKDKNSLAHSAWNCKSSFCMELNSSNGGIELKSQKCRIEKRTLCDIIFSYSLAIKF